MTMYDDHIVRKRMEALSHQQPSPFSPDNIMKILEQMGSALQPDAETLAKMPKILVLGQEFVPSPAAMLTMLRTHASLAASVQHMLDCKQCGPDLSKGQREVLKQVASVLDTSKYLPKG